MNSSGVSDRRHLRRPAARREFGTSSSAGPMALGGSRARPAERAAVHCTCCCSTLASVRRRSIGEPSPPRLRFATAGRPPWRSRRFSAIGVCRISRSTTYRSSSRSDVLRANGTARGSWHSRGQRCARRARRHSRRFRDAPALLRTLRAALIGQATPVVEALYELVRIRP